MASKDRSSSNSNPRRASDAAERTPVKKSSITRVRTGCFTCRKRKKKCDEKRPVCANCQKTGVVCEGFPQQVHWETRAALRRAESDMTMSMSNGIQNQMMASPGQTPGFDVPFMQDPQTMSNPMSTAFPQQNYGYIFDPHLENVDYIFDPVDTPMSAHEAGGFIVNDSRDLMLGRGGFSHEPIAYDGRHQQAMQQRQQTYIPKTLPFLISGVESDIHQRMFCHFTRNLSQVLTISIGDENPMNSVVIPLALRDRSIMDTILCLAGSHILKFHEGMTESDLREIRSETSKLHDAANTTQTYRLQTLQSTQTDTKILASSMNPGREVIFATSILLCLYEIVEGTSDSGWRTHLEAARQVITKAVEAVSPENNPRASNEVAEGHHVTEIDPFLIEYFLYHDTLAAVTVPSLQLTKLRSADLANHDPTMIGVQDGLSDFIARISTLRMQAASSPREVDGNVVSKAVLIWEDLHNWQPNGLISTERKMIAEFYRWALFIWLFSIVYPDGKEDPKVQEAVERIAGEMCNIKYGDSVMSCILFPLFVIGAAAIREEDRNIVAAQFDRLTAWSRLGNVDLTYQVVKRMWADHDNGVPRSWDWVKQLETHGRYLLVT